MSGDERHSATTLIDPEADVRMVEGLRVFDPNRRPGSGERTLRLLPLTPDGGVFMNPLDAEALKTWSEIRPRSAVRGGVRLARRIAGMVMRLPEVWPVRLHTPARLPRGAIALLRSQKIIVVDRLNQRVYKLLREDEEANAGLLEHEVTASTVLPGNTIETLFHHLESGPRFIVQPYVRYTPVGSCQDLLPRMDSVMQVLLRYYEHFGLEAVDARVCVERLLQRVDRGVRKHGIGDVVDDVRRRLETQLRRAGRCSIITAQVHGDLIASHVVRPVDRDVPGPILVDFSESNRHSVFFDLFYLQFQNYNTDFWDRWHDLDERSYAEYFGTGYRVLENYLQETTGIAHDVEQFRLNMLICLLQELDHRLYRLHPRYLAFWVNQVRRLTAARTRP